MIYFWNINSLIKDLRNGLVSEYEKMIYFVLTLLFQNNIRPLGGIQTLKVIQNSMVIQNINISLMDSAFSLLHLFIVLMGIFYCFQMNKKGDNKNFIERFICLTVPLAVRFFVFGLVGLVVSLFIAHISFLFVSKNFLSQDPASQLALKHLFLGTIVASYSSLLQILFYYILGKKIKEVGTDLKQTSF